MLYQVVLVLCKRKSTSTHYFWTYTMMIYVWLVFSVTGIGTVWDIISKGGLIETFQCKYAYAIGIFIAVYMEKF